MTLNEYFVKYKSVEYYIWARTDEIALAIAKERFEDDVEIGATGDTKWEFDDYD